MKWWKVLGLAGVAGVAATGVIVARAERRRLAYTPDEVRTRLHERFAEVAAVSAAEAVGGSQRPVAAEGASRRRRRFRLIPGV